MPENSLLLSTGQVSLGLSQCRSIPAGLREEEIETYFTLVFPLSGVFGVNTEGTQTAATPAKAVLFSQGQARQIHHPDGGHDQSAYISMSSGFAEPYLDTSGRFWTEASTTTPHLDYRLRCLIAAVKVGHVDALEVEDFTVGALTDLMEVKGAPPTGSRRDTVLDAEEYLSVHFRDQCDLSTIARHVGSSSHHLSRMFKQVTGESLSRRRMRLRITGALSEILDGADDLSRVAVESGFYDHSHMTNSFHFYFGVTPKEARLEATSRINPDVSTRIGPNLPHHENPR